MQRPAVRPRGKTSKLNVVAAVLIAAALLFSAYSGLRASFPASSPSSTSSTTGEDSSSGSGKINRLLRLDSRPQAEKIVDNLAHAIAAANDLAKSITAANSSLQPCHETIKEAASAVVLPAALAPTLPRVAAPPNPRMFHTVTTTQGFINHWQARIHYYHFKKQRAVCQLQDKCDMGGFTRLLHSGESDDLFDEVPTVVVSPLPKEMLKDSGYVVLNRPFAFLTWLKTASIPERYILMGEADHIFLRPLPNMMVGDAPAAFFFTYMVPEQYPEITRKFVGPISDAELKLVPRIGNSPTFVSVPDLRLLAPAWFNTTNAIFDDAEAHKAWNWVLEMYGFALAAYKVGLHKNMKYSTDLMAHPPFDKVDKDWQGAPFYLLHYTYPLNFGPAGNMTDKGPFLWKFDKRSYMGSAPPRHLQEPPPIVECHLARTLIQAFNEASDAIPCWDEYVATRKVTNVCPPVPAGATKVAAV